MNASAAALRIAIVGNPNSGKTALFNQLTGTRQKVANYAGVTIERKEGFYTAPSGRTVRVLDLPGRLQPRGGESRRGDHARRLLRALSWRDACPI